MRRGWWLQAIAVTAGCATTVTPPPMPAPAPSAAAILLARADTLLGEGDYEEAMRVYGDFARQYPADGAAGRARATREVLSSLAAASTEMLRINAEILRVQEQAENAEQELGRLRRDLGTRESELARVRQELADRQAELARQAAEAEQLRTDLEKLKNVDLRLERRR